MGRPGLLPEIYFQVGRGRGPWGWMESFH
jgi:hypothetical protein